MNRPTIGIFWIILNLLFSPSQAQTYLSEPDAVIYGTVKIDGQMKRANDQVLISARIKLGGYDPEHKDREFELVTYRLGDNQTCGDHYVLRIPMQWRQGLSNNSELVFGVNVPLKNEMGIITSWIKIPIKDRAVKIYVQDLSWDRAQLAYDDQESQRVGRKVSAEISLADRGYIAPITLDLGLDSDGDGLYNRLELAWGLDPNSNDTDGDRVLDHDEVDYDDSTPNQYNPYDPKTGRGTDLNANSSDTDLDGMSDADEIKWGLVAIFPNRYEDWDEDGYLNWEEVARGIDPKNPNAKPEKEFVFVDGAVEYDPNGPAPNGTEVMPFKTIQQGVDYAINHDEVILKDGIYKGLGNMDIEVLYKSITIAADSNEYGPDHCVIDCDSTGRGFIVLCDSNNTSVVLRGLTIKDGFARNGSAVYCNSGTLSIQNCLLVHNYAEADGGALFFTERSLPTIENVTIADNIAGGRGGAVYCEMGCDMTALNSILWNNTATFGGNEVYLADAAVWQSSEGSKILVSYSNLMVDGDSVYQGQGSTFHDDQSTNLREDPLFVRLGEGYWANNGTPIPQDDIWTWVDGDYRLKSQAGHWDPIDPNRPWVLDVATSPCIDAGDPEWPVGEESTPNGARINMGAYGGVGEASRSNPPPDDPA